MNRKVTWLVPKRQRTAHALMKSIGGGNDEFWCDIVRGQDEVRYPRKGEARCKLCIAYIRHAREGKAVPRRAKKPNGEESRIFHSDGRVREYPPGLAYAIWLGVPGTAIRTNGDERPVMPWEYSAGIGRRPKRRRKAGKERQR